MEIGIYENGKENKVKITEDEKLIFCIEDAEDILFPELVHGQYVKLEGAITRGNEKTDTLGFEYKGHTITCKPSEGHIAAFKKKLFLKDKSICFLEYKFKVLWIEQIKMENLKRRDR